ncbi:MAG TPA: hypothetical protein VFI31_16505 [Pirellulales bacterium]|nr:hypothetical protein [Pirellulales bacterium]
MSKTSLRIHVLVAALLAGTCFAVADEPSPKPARVRPPKVTLAAVARANLGDLQVFALTLEVANPNDASLIYTGYTADSFDPPLKAGHISPLCQIELKREGQWQIDPRGYCGFGMADVELAASSSATFGVSVPADDWQAVKVAFGHYPAWSAEETSTTTAWSTEFTREAIETATAIPLSQAAPERGSPVGKWHVEFAEGSAETCEVRDDGTASVVEPSRTSGGKTIVQKGYVLIFYDDDRVERWTPVGRRQVIEHWFPASQFSMAKPVLGVAERHD